MPRPDEGLIHAWLDGQLPPDEAARIDALAATDPEWAAAVAEARGLVAASSRILSALDRVPAGVVPRGTSSRTVRLPWWTKIAAAVVVVVGGSVVVMQNTPEERMVALSAEQGPGQPTPDTSKPMVKAPVASTSVPSPVPAATSSLPTARESAVAPASDALAGAGTGRADAPVVRREQLVAAPVIPPGAPAPPVSAIVAEARKSARDAERTAAELAETKSLVAKAAANSLQSAAPRAAPTAVPQARQTQVQTATQDLAQAQSAVPAQRVMGGVAASAKEQAQQANLCYRLVADSARAGAAVIMRAVRSDGDTLRLVPVESNVGQRAWIVWRDGMAGVMTTLGDVRSAVRVVATPTTCPAP